MEASHLNIALIVKWAVRSVKAISLFREQRPLIGYLYLIVQLKVCPNVSCLNMLCQGVKKYTRLFLKVNWHHEMFHQGY